MTISCLCREVAITARTLENTQGAVENPKVVDNKGPLLVVIGPRDESEEPSVSRVHCDVKICVLEVEGQETVSLFQC